MGVHIGVSRDMSGRLAAPDGCTFHHVWGHLALVKGPVSPHLPVSVRLFERNYAKWEPE
ncbi:hypothetical protein HQN89_26125 [Paenibacillus frigoriresistens]|nr:hypothetical protein [Paenibacillus frigoriresistens]NRF94395.1 hypothetical protein [Paenibacillus frigoriresistens]